MATSKSQKAAGGKKRRRPRCRICDKPIPVPKGWTQGPAVRKHYWAKHREIMSGQVEGAGGKTARGGKPAKDSSKTGRTGSKNRSTTRKKARS